MADRNPISIRLEDAHAEELERLAAEKPTTPGLMAKGLLAAAIDRARGTNGTEGRAIDVQALAAEIATQLQTKARLPNDQAIDELCTLLRECLPAIMEDVQKNRKETASLRQDLATLAGLLEAAQAEDGKPDSPQHNDHSQGLIQFDE